MAIIPCEDFVYLFDTHSRDTCDTSINKYKFDSYERVASYIYNLYVNSLEIRFDNQFIDCIASDLSNETIPILLISNKENNSDNVNAKTMDNRNNIENQLMQRAYLIWESVNLLNSIS